MREEWRDIKGYEGLYQVSNWGRIKSSPNRYQRRKMKSEGGIMKAVNIQGYLQVTLYKDRKHKRFMLHRLVAEAFVENERPSEFSYVNHKDENSLNNFASNLEWCTHRYNINYGTRNLRVSLKEGKNVYRYDLEGNFIDSFHSVNEAARVLGIKGHSHICQACNGLRHKAYGYKWKYEQETYKGDAN